MMPEARLYGHKGSCWISDPPTRDTAEEEREQRNLAVSGPSAPAREWGEAEMATGVTQSKYVLLQVTSGKRRMLRARNTDIS